MRARRSRAPSTQPHRRGALRPDPGDHPFGQRGGDRAEGLDGTSVGGVTAQTTDFVASVYGSFPLMLGMISLVTLRAVDGLRGVHHVVRTLLVPAAVSLFGRWNWWFPEPARRVLRVPARVAPGVRGPSAL